MIQFINLTFVVVILFLIYKIFKKIQYFQKCIEKKSYSEIEANKQYVNIKKLIGIGGGGSNIVEYITNESKNSYDSLVINSDKKALDQKRIINKLYLESKNNLGCGSNDKCGFQLINQSTIKDIQKIINNNSKVYIVSTLGGGVGSGSTKAIVKYLYEHNIEIHISVVFPFKWEGIKRTNRAIETLSFIRPYCKTIKQFYNDDFKKYNTTSMKECFSELNRSIDEHIETL